jgi:hypothetical protein
MQRSMASFEIGYNEIIRQCGDPLDWKSCQRNACNPLRGSDKGQIWHWHGMTEHPRPASCDIEPTFLLETPSGACRWFDLLQVQSLHSYQPYWFWFAVQMVNPVGPEL